MDRVRRQSGFPLAAEVKEFFERGLGQSLDAIRVHVDRDAADAVDAQAFAVGRHIVFRDWPTDWDSPESRYLLAHELAHCIQQRSVKDDAPLADVGAAQDAEERDAHDVAVELAAGRAATPWLREHQAVVRRALTVKPNTARIEFVRRPSVKDMQHRVRTPDRNTNETANVRIIEFSCTPIEPMGSAVILGDGGSMKGSRLGFVQLLRESNFAIYHGRTPADGSVLVRKAGDSTNRWNACRDVLNDPILVDAKAPAVRAVPARPGVPAVPEMAEVDHPYYEVTSDSPLRELPLVARYRDDPSERYDQIIMNKSTRNPRPNFIDEIRIELNFCVVLTFIPPRGAPQYLKHFMWHVHWNYGFGPPDAKGDIPFENRDGLGAGVDGQVVDGPPTGEFAKMLANTSLPKCELLTRNADWGVKDRLEKNVQQSATKSKFGLI